MMAKPAVMDDGCTVTVRVPISIRKRGGRKLILTPEGGESSLPITRHVDNAVVKAIARGFRWRLMLEKGEYATVREIARAEKINESYVGRVLRLTLLAPDIVEAILCGRHPTNLDLKGILRAFPVSWLDQLADRRFTIDVVYRSRSIPTVPGAGCRQADPAGWPSMGDRLWW